MFRTFALTAAAVATFAGAAAAETVTALTSADGSPFSRGYGEELPGFNHEVMHEAAERVGVELKIEYLPWERAQKMALDGAEVLIFSLTRTEVREPQYQWVSPIVDVDRVFVSLGEPINGYEDAADKKIGARSVFFQSLESQGFPGAEEGTIPSSLRKMQAGRIDGVYSLAQRIVFEWQQLGFDPAELTIGTPVRSNPEWLGASMTFDPEMAAAFANAIEEMRADGTYDEIKNKYFGGLNIQ